jgi:hypothetical protein
MKLVCELNSLVTVDSDIRKANESIKRECSKFIDLKNVRLELNEHASHSYAWWFPDGKENNTSG